MRELLRGRRRVAFASVGIVCLLATDAAAVGAETSPFEVRITSPLGRSGLPGKVRIVARVTGIDASQPPVVRFFVNDALLAEDRDGAPFVAEWEDINPFESCRLRVEVLDEARGTRQANLALEPFEFVETTHITSVGVDATVRDAKGRFVAGLSPDDFTLSEDGVNQKIDRLVSESVPTMFALLVDASQSMSRNIGFVKRAADRFFDYLRSDDTMVVAPFRQGIAAITGPTRDRATIAEAVAAIQPNGGTAILDALVQVSQRFSEGVGRRVVVLATDGYDERSQGSIDQVLERVKASRVTVYVVAIGGIAGVSISGERLLRRLAHETGGRAFFPWDDKQLADAYATIAEDVQQLYQLTYTPNNQTQDGTWRTISLASTRPDHVVRARTGYRAPSPPPVRASIEFTATDGRQQLLDLAREEVAVLEDGVLQAVDVFNEAVAPVSVVLAVDASGSMTKVAPAVQEAAHTFVDTLRADDALGVVVFADRAAAAAELSTKRDESHAAMREYRTAGGTALYDALVESIAALKTVEGRRVVVVMTDGRDENAASNGPGSVRTWDDVVASAAQVDVTIYAIGFGTRVDRDRLMALTSATGGEAYFTSDVNELQPHYRRIVDELHRRYVLAYTSTNPERNGKFRKVEIRSNIDGMKIRSRGGYFAPQ